MRDDFRQGSEKALDLLDVHGGRLHGLLTRLTLSPEAVGDLLQELFLRLSRSRGFLRADDPLAYACRSAMNLAFAWRKQRRRRDERCVEGLDEAALPAAAAPSPLAELVRREQCERILDLLPRLSRLSREVVVLHYLEQESYEDIARRLGKKPQHVRSASAKALARLRLWLGRDD